MRGLIVSLAVAYLCTIRLWRDLIVSKPEQEFVLLRPPGAAEFAATVALMVALAAVCLGLRQVHSRFRYVIALVFTGLVLSGLYGIAAAQVAKFRAGHSMVWPAAGAVALAVVAIRFRKPIQTALPYAVCGIVATIPFTMIEGALALWSRNERFPTTAAVRNEKAHRPAENRIVWLIFDEWDYRLTFENPRPGQWPEIDSLRRDSVFFTHADPPADSTERSVPALIYGARPVDAVVRADEQLHLRFENGREVTFGEAPNIFSTLHEMGINSAAIGWYLPYCTRFQDELSSCWWGEFATQASTMRGGFGTSFARQARSLVETSLFSPFGQSLTVKAHADLYQELVGRAERAVVNESVGLMFLHFNVPHPPVIYDPSNGRADRGNTLGHYTANISLVDATVAKLRRAMEARGMWDRTTLIVSSDHGYRESELVNGRRDNRVPFMVRFAAGPRAEQIEPAFETVRTGALVRAIADGSVRDKEHLIRWLTGSIQ